MSSTASIEQRVAGVHLIGNNGANKLTGNELSNTLDGGLGADTLIGGGGSDTYYVDAGDTVEEDTGGTNDRVIVTETGSYILATKASRTGGNRRGQKSRASA